MGGYIGYTSFAFRERQGLIVFATAAEAEADAWRRIHKVEEAEKAVRSEQSSNRSTEWSYAL